MGILEDAIKIANNTRNAVLNGQNSLTTNFLGFISVAQILSRKEDLDWGLNELNGYSDYDGIPAYRDVFGVLSINNKPFYPDRDSHFSSVSLITNIYRLIEMAKSKERISLTLDKEQLEQITNQKFSILPDNRININPDEISKIIGKIELQLILRLNNMLNELTYEKIPQDIFKEFQDKVNNHLSQSNIDAVSTLNLAYANLEGSEDPNRAALVSVACRRLIKHIADDVFPARSESYQFTEGEKKIPLDVSDPKVLNRLQAYADSITLPIRKQILAQVTLLRQFYSGDEGVINKGLHDNISITEAKRMVLFTYVLLGDILLAKEKQG